MIFEHSLIIRVELGGAGREHLSQYIRVQITLQCITLPWNLNGNLQSLPLLARHRIPKFPGSPVGSPAGSLPGGRAVPGARLVRCRLVVVGLVVVVVIVVVVVVAVVVVVDVVVLAVVVVVVVVAVVVAVVVGAAVVVVLAGAGVWLTILGLICSCIQSMWSSTLV